MNNNIRISIIMGSDSDLPVMQKAIDVCSEFNINCEVKILSAHRTPDQHAEFAKSARKRGIKVIIAAAGGAAHLPGVTAGHTTLPVIGVPIKSSSLDGLDSLLSIVQMPSGVPVATVAINGAKNAALLALQIIGVADEAIAKKLDDYKITMAEQSMKKNEVIDS
ncbi:MAG: 5-(carboxyamino)imidazole ribonucleotide mutase [Melioribacteraceae bacterium]|nr:5-(carboxyamino)imidazole ribonucleotide mutase [Melioribacteraceae bacterium]MCF8352860.1 5-(carboxyamino)imidazole ribonucleotide mutase [Melioribacteraceae bacterium]MCF8393823.1 5-(carboxyamino)imidazole ribonucleotide mutase [Melioribacteraceae bacterium]MCF8417377.1 5-(carboxyamino)imidazole ribonucleotide mutase [Melioribacteraceae bacterium]